MRERPDADRSGEAAVAAAPRPPAEVLAAARAGASWPTALSFTRAFMRKMVREHWRVERVRFELDAEGRGEGLYRLTDGSWCFHFLVLSDVFPQDQKVDRSFGINWDVSAALCQGEWTQERETVLRREIPRQYAGRYDDGTLCFSRGNRSERIFDYVVDSLAEGRQPDPTLLAAVGYIFRTTAFAGNGLFGMRAFAGLEPDHPLGRSYHAQIAIAFMLRGFVFDLVDHLAAAKSAGAARLDRALKRYVGIGNSAGLGLIPFAVQHPQVVGRWCQLRERALAQARARPVEAGTASFARFASLLERAIRYFREDPRDGNGIFAPYDRIASELEGVRGALTGCAGSTWEALCRRVAGHVHAETLEAVHTILLDLYPDIVEAHEGQVNAVERFDVHPEMPLAELRRWMMEGYGWLLPSDAALEDATAFFWYYPVEAPDEPRRGPRRRVPEMEFESRMDGALLLHRLKARLDLLPEDMTTAELLARHPELRSIVTRIQSLRDHPYAELRENYTARTFTPFNATRFVLAFYGMEKLDPRPPRSVKGALLQGAPLAEDIAQGIDGDWPFPLVPTLDRVQAAGDIGGRPLRSVESAELTPKRIQQITPATAPAKAAPADGVALFPVEYRKLLTKALLARGVPLGLADEIVSMAEFADALDRGGLIGLVDRLETGGTLAPTSAEVVRGRQVDTIDARGEPAFLHLPGGLDLADAAALTNAGGIGVARIVGAEGSILAAYAAHRAALRGLACCVEWTEASAGTPVRRAAIAGPDVPAPWLALHETPSTTIGLPIPDDLRALLAAYPESDARPAVTIVCLRSTGPGPLAAGPGIGSWDGAAVERAIRRLSEHGTALSYADFERLTLLAKPTLVPEGAEARILA